MPQGTETDRGLEEEKPIEETDAIEEAENAEPEEAADAEAPEPGESARETVAKALKKAQAEANGDEDPDGPQEQTETVKQKPVKGRRAAPVDDIRPPERLTAEQKEVFNAAPPKLKQAFAEMVRHHETKFTQTQQAAHQEINKARGVLEAVEPYITKWGQRGFTAPSAIAALCAAQERLTDPKTSKEAFLSLGADLGFDTKALARAINHSPKDAAGDMPQDISNHPQFRALQEKVSSVDGFLEQQKAAQVQSAVQSIVSELETVRDEKDSLGRYRYPKLHEDEFLDRVKPLVSALVQSNPRLSYGDAMRRAYVALEDSAQANQTRLPAGNNTNIQQRAANAAFSVRGRSAPVVQAGGEIPPEALGNDPRDSVRWALQTLRRG